jgi:hypothetical protein
MNARSVLGRPLPKYTLVYSDESICTCKDHINKQADMCIAIEIKILQSCKLHLLFIFQQMHLLFQQQCAISIGSDMSP